MPKQKLVEVARSYSYKLNLGNYENADFFCSQKAEVPEEEAENTSRAIYEFCKTEVIASVNAYKKQYRIDHAPEIIKKLQEYFRLGGDKGGITQAQKQEIYDQISACEEIKAENDMPIIEQ